jgi:hypothetical protein
MVAIQLAPAVPQPRAAEAAAAPRADHRAKRDQKSPAPLSVKAKSHAGHYARRKSDQSKYFGGSAALWARLR